MINVQRLLLITLTLLLNGALNATAIPFDLVTPKTKVSIVYAADDRKLDSIAAHLLAQDIQRVTGYLPHVYTDVNNASGNLILIGTVNSSLVKSLRDNSFASLNGKWECYVQKVLDKPFKNADQVLVITGSDSRGTAYGVFNLSEKIGVSPWYWWADVTPTTKTQLSIAIESTTSNPPSVKFRGIFINDEDWGLQPWAAKTFEPETKDIGPKTYARVFELLLRLRANLIWPGMHPSTKPFYTIPGNKDVADAYEIIVGTSHAEPMLRNNVREWDKKSMGAFNYITNKPAVYSYWESRVKQAGVANVMYTIGMRGVHDSGMEGVKGTKEAVPLLEQIFADQRDLLQKHINPDVTKVPQVFTLYKEVLDVYANGLKVPDDVTLIWPDDNYGYIHQLSNADETKRSGGSGVYYHASYWGRPHDYLWLSTTHPALMREEMTKAYTMNARQIWVLNVGDIKPGEYDLQLFMDMAYQVEPFMDSRYSRQHLQNWVSQLLGSQFATSVAKNLWDYFQLAFERKPEYMGWSQTEPTTPVKPLTAYNHHFFNDQAQRRLDRYDELEKEVRTISSRMPAHLKNAYYELVEYPIVGASLMNKKFLYRDKANLYAEQGRITAHHYATLSKQAYEAIVRETDYFNNQLAQGKWKGMMSMNPRELPVYELPTTNFTTKSTGRDWQVTPEGYSKVDSDATLALPEFDQWNKQRYFIDVFLSREISLPFTITTSANWIKVSQMQGTLTPKEGQSEAQLWVEIDWVKAPKQALSGSVSVVGGSQTISVSVKANNANVPELNQYKDFVEAAGFIAIDAASTSTRTGGKGTQWEVVDGLGSAGKALEALPLSVQATTQLSDTTLIRSNPSVTYDFYTFHPSPADFSVYTLPTFPLNNEQEMRYAVCIDGGALTVLNFKTVGRTDEWKQNVLSNVAVRTIKQASLPAGKHTLTIYKIDPGVILDRIFINLGNQQSQYGAVPETAHSFSK
ncbi:glycosyl hydrolase 115 family protein [Spirosoma sp. BT702]|uniref:Glycosyl hydrolase 115 family protein n=1 Tax=Spirosoma profusum TaxID=2771354 RepID=A0A926XU73_9BACT|nr:glycosyl hydrolase 115 family protein [Spirosoma profusum]MBD2700504.1 glycosyl hydrolase 115 family protein [Spirosoma profusum]